MKKTLTLIAILIVFKNTNGQGLNLLFGKSKEKSAVAKTPVKQLDAAIDLDDKSIDFSLTGQLVDTSRKIFPGLFYILDVSGKSLSGGSNFINVAGKDRNQSFTSSLGFSWRIFNGTWTNSNDLSSIIMNDTVYKNHVVWLNTEANYAHDNFNIYSPVQVLSSQVFKENFNGMTYAAAIGGWYNRERKVGTNYSNQIRNGGTKMDRSNSTGILKQSFLYGIGLTIGSENNIDELNDVKIEDVIEDTIINGLARTVINTKSVKSGTYEKYQRTTIYTDLLWFLPIVIEKEHKKKNEDCIECCKESEAIRRIALYGHIESAWVDKSAGRTNKINAAIGLLIATDPAYLKEKEKVVSHKAKIVGGFGVQFNDFIQSTNKIADKILPLLKIGLTL